MVYRLLLLIFIISGCGYIPPKWIRYNDGGKQAVAKAYHLSKKPFVYSSLIDTNYVYISVNEYLTTNRQGEILVGLRDKYDYIRFGGDGKMVIRDRMTNIPTDEELNKMERAQYCFYTIEDKKIKIELFNHDTRVFEYWFGKIQENGDILFYKRKGRPWGKYTGKLNYYYRKTPAKLTTPIVFPE